MRLGFDTSLHEKPPRVLTAEKAGCEPQLFLRGVIASWECWCVKGRRLHPHGTSKDDPFIPLEA